MNNFKKEDYFKKYKRYYTAIIPFIKNKRVVNYTYLILTFFTASFFAYAAIKPTITTIVSLKRQIIDGGEADQKLQEKIRALSIGQETIAGIGNDLPIIEEIIPDKPSVDFLVKQLENLALVNSVTFNSLAFEVIHLTNNKKAIQNSLAKSELEEINISFSVKGSYENINTFLEKARNLRRLLVIENISITKNKSKTDERILTLIANTKAFYRN